MSGLKKVWSRQKSLLDLTGTDFDCWTDCLNLTAEGWIGAALVLDVTSLGTGSKKDSAVRVSTYLDHEGGLCPANYEDVPFAKFFVWSMVSVTQLRFTIENARRFKVKVTTSGSDELIVRLKARRWLYEKLQGTT
jgi:hypothetical protein